MEMELYYGSSDIKCDSGSNDEDSSPQPSVPEDESTTESGSGAPHSAENTAPPVIKPSVEPEP